MNANALEQMATRCETPEFRPEGEDCWALLATLCRYTARLVRAQEATGRTLEQLNQGKKTGGGGAGFPPVMGPVGHA